MPELAVSATGVPGADGDRAGAILVLFLARQSSSVTVSAAAELTAIDLGVPGGETYVGLALATLADLDGNGHEELVVGCPACDHGGEDNGAVIVAMLHDDSGVRVHRAVVLSELSNFMTASPEIISRNFGSSIASMTDFDSDGKLDIAVGVQNDLADRSGSVYVLSLRRDGTVARSRRISNGYGGLNEAGVAIGATARFGSSVAYVGDLDGNGAYIR